MIYISEIHRKKLKTRMNQHFKEMKGIINQIIMPETFAGHFVMHYLNNNEKIGVEKLGKILN